MNPTIRLETPADHEAVRRVNRLAFGQDDEARIVEALRDGGHARVSLVAEVDGEVVGHILFSDLPVLTHEGPVPTLSLAPMAVLPGSQKQGIGSALVRGGLTVCRERGHRAVVVLGHSHFYPRFAFSAKLAEPLLSPFHAGDSWMALELEPGALKGVAGWVNYPPPFGLGVQVRPAYRPDRGEWLRMRVALWPEEGGTDHAEEVGAYFAPGSSGSRAVFVAERVAGGLCGFIETSIRAQAEGCQTRPVGYVEGWYADPDMRRQGVGRKLVEAAETWAAARGCEEMASDAHIENALSHDAHKATGYEEVDRVVHFRKALRVGREVRAPRPPVVSQHRVVGVPGMFAVCKLSARSEIPPWATAGGLFSVTRTADELSVIVPEKLVPEGVACERGWSCLRVAGAMPFTLVGVLASLTTPLAQAGVSVVAFSTFDTDYLLIKESDIHKAVAALRGAGHAVESVEDEGSAALPGK